MPLTIIILCVTIAAVSVYGAFFYRYTPRHERITDYLTYGAVLVILATLMLSVPPLPMPV